MKELKSEEPVSPTQLKWVARSFKDKQLNGNSGLAILADRVRQLTDIRGSDRQVIHDYFRTLGKPSVPRKKGPPQDIDPVITERTDFSLPIRPSRVLPWE